MSHLLLLDLDGVLVCETAPLPGPRCDLLRLHEDLHAGLKRIGMPIVILTQRSRIEAKRILQVLSLTPSGLFAAEDLLLAGLHWSRFGHLLRFGLCKTLALPLIEKYHGVRRGDMAFVDDRADILDAMSQKGLGFALRAPFLMEDKILTTFAFTEALQRISDWRTSKSVGASVTLSPICRPISAFRAAGVDTSREARRIFNEARRLARGLRVRMRLSQGPKS